MAYLKLARLVANGSAEKSTLYAQARTELGKAYKLDPSSGPALVYLSQAEENLPNYLDENAVNAAQLANGDDGGNVYCLTKLYIVRQDYAKALDVIQKMFWRTTTKPTKASTRRTQLIDLLTNAKAGDDAMPIVKSLADWHGQSPY